MQQRARGGSFRRGHPRHSSTNNYALEKGLDCFTQALAVEPAYAQAHAGIALIQTYRALLSFAAPQQVMPMAKEAALKALAIDETVADAHLAQAFVLGAYECNWAGAEREYRRALELNPGDTQARSNYADLLGRLGRADASVAEARHAIEYDPLSIIGRHFLAVVLYLARRFDAAMGEARAGIELEPTSHILCWNLGLALAGLGRYDEAVEAMRQATILAPGDPTAQAFLGWALGLAGHRQEALVILSDLERRRTQEYFSGWWMANVYLGLGDREQAISWLQKAAEERDVLLPYTNEWVPFDPLRSDPRFQALLRKMNFPAQA